MAEIFNLNQIKEVIGNIDAISCIEEGFAAYSQGKVVVPPIGELIFDNPPGDTHIKYGYIKEDEYFIIKIASGFYENYKLNLPSNSGLMLLFKQKTGELACILLDEGYLTDLRTAAAGAVAARYLAPKNVHHIGIFGAGIQGRMQLEYLKSIVNCKDVIVWGINREELDLYKNDMEPHGYNVQTTLEADDIAASCNLIVMATPSKTPLLQAGQIRKGTHITAMGSDTSEKQELDAGILRKADIVAADSIGQSDSRGEVFKAKEAGVLTNEDIVELGNVITNKELQRTSDDQITVADLTGVAVQDIQISKAVYEALIL